MFPSEGQRQSQLLLTVLVLMAVEAIGISFRVRAIKFHE